MACHLFRIITQLEAVSLVTERMVTHSTEIRQSKNDSRTKCVWKWRPFCWGLITVKSWWARWRLKSPASWLFTATFIQAQIKENVKAPRHWSFVRGIHRWPVNSPHKGPVTRKMFPFDDVIMCQSESFQCSQGHQFISDYISMFFMANT